METIIAFISQRTPQVRTHRESPYAALRERIAYPVQCSTKPAQLQFRSPRHSTDTEVLPTHRHCPNEAHTTLQLLDTPEPTNNFQYLVRTNSDNIRLYPSKSARITLSLRNFQHGANVLFQCEPTYLPAEDDAKFPSVSSDSKSAHITLALIQHIRAHSLQRCSRPNSEKSSCMRPTAHAQHSMQSYVQHGSNVLRFSNARKTCPQGMSPVS